MGTNSYVTKLKARLDQAITQRDHWKQLAENRNSIVVTEVCPESRSVEEYVIDADSVRASWRLIRGYREQIEALRAALLGIASVNPAERGIEWAKSYASDGLNGAGSELYARWLDTFKEAEALRGEISDLHTTMMAAAVEIQEHWAAHCDEEGYGPANLMHRLERGIASQYGYTARTLVMVEAERDALAAELAAIKRQGDVVEVAQVVSYLSACADGYDPDAPHPVPPEPLMTVAQHERIMAASAPAGCKVVPVDLIERTICRLIHGHEHDKAVRELRAILEAKDE